MGGIPGIVGAIGGLLACIASSMLMCCAPKKVEEGPCKFTAAGVMLLIAGILQIIMMVVVVVFMILAVTEVNEEGYCGKVYIACDNDSNGCSCKDGTSGYLENDDGTTSVENYCSANTEGLCYDWSVDDPSDTSRTCAPTEELGLGLGGGGDSAAPFDRRARPHSNSSAISHPQLTGARRATGKTFARRPTARASRLSRCRSGL